MNKHQLLKSFQEIATAINPSYKVFIVEDFKQKITVSEMRDMIIDAAVRLSGYSMNDLIRAQNHAGKKKYYRAIVWFLKNYANMDYEQIATIVNKHRTTIYDALNKHNQSLNMCEIDILDVQNKMTNELDRLINEKIKEYEYPKIS